MFSRQLWANPRRLGAVGIVLVLQGLAVVWAPLQSLFGTVDLTGGQTLICVAVASAVTGVEELRKLGTRAWLRRR